MEASTAGWRKPVCEQYPHLSILRSAFELQIPITTASDAHSYAQVAADYERLATILDAAGVAEIVRLTATTRPKKFRDYEHPGNHERC